MQEDEEVSNPCPIARGLDLIGDRWSMLILRDVGRGFTRFDQIRTSLQIAPNILSARLATLTRLGLLTRQRYSETPPRDEYVLSEAGQDFVPVLAAIGAWGRKHRGGGPLSHLMDSETGHIVEPVVIDRISGAPIGSRSLTLVQPD
jgi:DNA-binding HxlR family transcriptional regulator